MGYATNNSVLDLPPEQYIIIDTKHILNEYYDSCLTYGEVPIVDLDNQQELDFFMDSLCSNLAYRPCVHDGVECLLKNSGEYLERDITPIQEQLWRVAASEIWDTFDHLYLYGNDLIHRFEYHRMLGKSMIMRLAH